MERDLLPSNGNFYLYRKDKKYVWVFYAIKEPIDFFEIMLEMVYGAYLSFSNGRKREHLIMINLTAPYSGKYSIRTLVETCLHELLHAEGIRDEIVVEILTKKLLRGYRFNRL
ncbi:MAG: hypothetical protein NDF54_07390 [archaeon GB-1867-035]|nr:hypothetical protein [Candidatus Culexmicrobium profundum]